MVKALNLAAYTGLVSAASGTAPDADIDIDLIYAEKQVRTEVGDLTEIAESIKAQGVLQPILVHAQEDGRYLLIAGERRWRAARLAGLTSIPVKIKRGLDPKQIRVMQVTENNERKDLTAYEEAMGVAEDVEKYGFEEACVMWNRSGSWVSKRKGVSGYIDPVQKLLKAGKSTDFEVLGSLNQLYGINKEMFDGLMERIRKNEVVGRDEARSAVARAKSWGKQMATAKKDKAASAANDATHQDDGDGGLEDESDNQPAAEAERRPVKAKAATSAKPAKPSQVVAEDHQANLLAHRDRIIQIGVALRAHCVAMQSDMQALGFELPDGEWVLWSAFLDSMSPMMDMFGPDRAQSYAKRLAQELKSSEGSVTPLHTSVHESDDVNTPGSKPEGWIF